MIFHEVFRCKLQRFVWRGLVLATLIGAIVRVFIIAAYQVKDPGIYTFTGVFVSVAMLYSINYMPVKNIKFYSCFFIWILVLFLYLSVSRTELVIYTFSVLLLLIKAPRLIIPFFIFGFGFLFFSIPYIPEYIINYLYHKFAFFNSIIDNNLGVGDSASVRYSTFLNLIDGWGSDLFNVFFGRGFWGYIDFSSYPDASIYTEGAFSSYEHSIGKYYHLHFFLNNVLFYFGVIGLSLFLIGYAFMIASVRDSLELILFSYFIFNFMFRLELIVIIPILLYVYRDVRRSHKFDLKNGIGG